MLNVEDLDLIMTAR